MGLQRVRHDWVTELKLWLVETGSPREIWEDILWILKTNGNVCSYPIVFRQICNSRKNQIIGQRWRRVNNELLPVRSLKRPLPGAPDVSSQLVSSLQFYLCWTLASFFCLAAHFPHPQPILCIKLLSKPEAKNWEGTCWQSVGYTASRIYFTSVNIHPYLTSTYWMIFPHHLQKMFCMSSSLSEAVEWKKNYSPLRGQKIIYVGANQIFLRLLYCHFSQWWTDVNFFWYTKKKSIMFSPSWHHLRLLFLLYF